MVLLCVCVCVCACERPHTREKHSLLPARTHVHAFVCESHEWNVVVCFPGSCDLLFFVSVSVIGYLVKKVEIA